MNLSEFAAKWRRAELTERAAAQEHFLDLCSALDHPTPAEADPSGDWFALEKGASKHGGGDGWADVWKKGFFAIEYKGKHKNLDAAYDQLLKYRESLENPPLLVVCDMDRIVIRTNFTATATQKHDISLDDIGAPRSVEILRALFHDPDKLRPGATIAAITSQAAAHLAEIAQAMRARGLDPHDVAHFLDRIVFCLFAEDIGLLPENVFTRIAEKSLGDPPRFSRLVAQLFAAMAHGGDFGADTIRHFNGNLFVEGPMLDLTEDEIESVTAAAHLDWSAVDPSIFGTLFERGMDPAKRSQLGAHYTSRHDIETLVEPVVMSPLRREWENTKLLTHRLIEAGKDTSRRQTKKPSARTLRKERKEARLVLKFLRRLAHVRILDPACGSGNFLYVALQKLKDLEKQVILYAGDQFGMTVFPEVGPWQLYGIEISPYAFELAQMTVWIGYLQWTRANGFGIKQDPILKPTKTFHNIDAILDLSDPDHPKEPQWPASDFIVGNPPFLGGNKIRQELGDEYVNDLFHHYRDRVPPFADLCCYWFEKARSQIEANRCKRAGLLATQSIRGGASRDVLKRIKASGGIFFAHSDRPWVLEGANVHVSMVGFDDSSEPERILDGTHVHVINADLTSSADVTSANVLTANKGICFMGPSPKAPFDIDETTAMSMLLAPNPTGRPNSDVLRRVASATDLAKNDRLKWTIDFALLSEDDAASYQDPFEYARDHVYPKRANNPSQTNPAWWQYERPRVEMRRALAGQSAFASTPSVAKHRIFVWRFPETLCNQGTLVFARSDDYLFGVLHSRIHELWARAQGTQLRERESGFRYTPTTCFETFPFPDPTGAQREAIAAAAKKLNQLRENWLNPPEWTQTEILEFPGSTNGPWARYLHDVDPNGIGTVRYPRLIPKDPDCAQKLKKRTLTNLYNQRPTWLTLAHQKLDSAVLEAYGWDAETTDDQILENVLQLNLERARNRK